MPIPYTGKSTSLVSLVSPTGRTMKIRIFIVAILVAVCFAITKPGFADEVVNTALPSDISTSEILNGEDFDPTDVVALERTNPPGVPEPATFGLIALGLAVGGGLLVRRKH